MIDKYSTGHEVAAHLIDWIKARPARDVDTRPSPTFGIVDVESLLGGRPSSDVWAEAMHYLGCRRRRADGWFRYSPEHHATFRSELAVVDVTIKVRNTRDEACALDLVRAFPFGRQVTENHLAEKIGRYRARRAIEHLIESGLVAVDRVLSRGRGRPRTKLRVV